MPEETTADVYYGDKKVLEVELEEATNTVRLTLELLEPIENEDGSKDVAEKISVPDWEYEAIISSEPTDATRVRNERSFHVVDKIYDLLKDLDVRTEDLAFIIQRFLAKVQGIEEQGLLNVYRTSDRGDVRISHFENLLKKDQ